MIEMISLNVRVGIRRRIKQKYRFGFTTLVVRFQTGKCTSSGNIA